MRFAQPTLVVFEGMDKSGKSTQLELFEALPWTSPKPFFTRQPGGTNVNLCREIYRITEENLIRHPMTRQFLHLAAHWEHYELEVLPALAGGRSVVMDRCWWSTVAYGWDGAADNGFSIEEWVNFVTMPTRGTWANMTVVYFGHQYGVDSNNKESVLDGYEYMLERHPGAILAPAGEPVDVFTAVMNAFNTRDLLIPS